MPTDLPIACTLTATEYPQRLAEMRAIGEAAMVNADTQPARAVLRFAAGAGIRERVDAIVAAESQCCSFLDMAVTDEPDTVVLTIEAPEDAELVLAELVAAFRGVSQLAA